MNIREVPATRAEDAEILAALQGLVPVNSGGVFLLLPKRKVIGLVEERRADGGDVAPLLAALEFDGEAEFRRTFSMMATRRLELRTSTLFRLLDRAARSGMSLEQVLRRSLHPVISATLDEMTIDQEMSGLVRSSLADWAEARPSEDADDLLPQPLVLETSLEGDDVPPDLRKYGRYFLKDLFRLNNIYGDDQFYHPPEVIEDYWEVVAPDQAMFLTEIDPAGRCLTARVFRTTRSFGLVRTDNPDYYGLVEFLVDEMRLPRIHGCQAEVRGTTPQDQIGLEEALSIESVMVEDPAFPGHPVSLPHALSEQGRKMFRDRLARLSGITARVRFPVNLSDPDQGDQDFSVLGFDLEYDEDIGRFVLDGEVVSPGTMHLIVVAIGTKLLALSRHVYRDPPHFPQPDVDELDGQVRDLMARAEGSELTEELAREIVAKITVLDYYEALAKFSFALGESIVDLLDGSREVEITMPRALMAVLDVALGEEADKAVRNCLEAGER